MKSIAKKIFLALGVAVVSALSASNIGLAQCGGLFLLHQDDKQLSARSCHIQDVLEINDYKVYGSYEHFIFMGRYSDRWHIKGLNEQDIASFGFEKSFRFIDLNIGFNGWPSVRASLSVHQDSLIKLSTTIARGKFDLGTISWIPEKNTDLVGTIPVDWETHFLYRQISTESKIGGNRFKASAAFLQTTPHNPDKDYYIRDSLNALAINGEYGHAFNASDFKIGYTFVDTDLELFGIYHNANSRKRFMYLPLEMQAHLGYGHLDFKQIKTHFGVARIWGKLNSNPNRFFETLAPNRALPASVIKGLSFAFLQKTFRVDADINAKAIAGGATYSWHLGDRYQFIPTVGLDIFAASGEIEIQKKIETLVLLTQRTDYESTHRELSSIGSVLTLNGKLQKNGCPRLSLDYGISQIIPFFIDYKDVNAKDGADAPENTTKPDASKDKSGSLEKNAGALLFRNGFATRLGFTIQF